MHVESRRSRSRSRREAGGAGADESVRVGGGEGEGEGDDEGGALPPGFRCPYFMPGRILYFERGDEVDSKSCDPCCWFGTIKRYEPRWATAGEFQEILVSPSMFVEHFPDRVHAVLHATARRHAAT